MSKYDVFKFAKVRPPQKVDNQTPNNGRYLSHGESNIRTTTSFHEEIRELNGEKNAYNKATNLARRFIESDKYLPGEPKLVQAVRKACVLPKVTDAKKLISDELGMDVSSYLKNNHTAEVKERLWNSLYAQFLAPSVRPHDRDNIYDTIRAFHFLKLLEQNEDDEGSPMSWTELKKVKPTIPLDLVLRPSSDGKNNKEDEFKKSLLKEADKVKEKVFSLKHSITELGNLDRIYNANEPRKISVNGNVVQASKDGGFHIQSNPFDISKNRPVKSRLNNNNNKNKNNLARDKTKGNIKRVKTTTTIGIQPMKPWVFEDFGDKNLSQPAKNILKERKKELEGYSVREMISKLEKEKYELASSFIDSLSDEARMIISGSESLNQLNGEVVAPFDGVDRPDKGRDELEESMEPAEGSAADRGIKPLGVGDLFVVKQKLLRYEPGEVAHVENVLLNENKSRTHTRTSEIEETVTVEKEEKVESEQDLQSTERFELQKESQETIESEMNFGAGVSLTGSYGLVSVTANVDYAYNESSSETNRDASNFAKEVTERSVSRIMERVREQRVRRTLERIEEKNEHMLDNRGGQGNITGVYRWLDKYYRMRIVNYGRRLMMEFIVPEPGAFYLYASNNQKARSISGISKPNEPKVKDKYGIRKLRPYDLKKGNYMKWVAWYNAQDVEPYPEETVRKSFALAKVTQTEDSAGNVSFTEKTIIDLPEGYETAEIDGWAIVDGWNDPDAGVPFTPQYIYISVGGSNAWEMLAKEEDPSLGTLSASNVEGVEKGIAVSVNGWGTSYNVNIIVTCKLKEEKIEQWQLKTFQAIMNAYERAFADYNEQVAAAQIQAGVQIQGMNPEINRKIEQDELKKGSLRLLTREYRIIGVPGVPYTPGPGELGGQPGLMPTPGSIRWLHKEKFNAMGKGDHGYPEIYTTEALEERYIIQFFEQAFEWENMTYRFYPYFWGRKKYWKDTFSLLNDPDPQFADFLRSGAARVVIPVRPAYTEAILHYMYTNEIWGGEELPGIGDPLYLSIIEEIKADTGADTDDENLPKCTRELELSPLSWLSPFHDIHSYPCLIDEWETKVPTSLVYLQQDSSLPTF